MPFAAGGSGQDSSGSCHFRGQSVVKSGMEAEASNEEYINDIGGTTEINMVNAG